MSAAVDDAFATAHDGRETVSQSLITNADGLADQAANYAKLADSLDALAKGMPDGSSVELTQMASTLRAVSTTMERLSRQLGTTAGDLEYGISGAEVARNDINAQIAEAKQQVQDAKNQYNNDVKPNLDNLVSSVTDATSLLSSSASKLDDAARARLRVRPARFPKSLAMRSRNSTAPLTNSTNRPRSSMTCRRI